MLHKFQSGIRENNYYSIKRTHTVNMCGCQGNNTESRVHPLIKLKSKLLTGSSLNLNHIKIASMRLLNLNFKSVSQYWQPWARNWQHCISEKQAFTKNPTPPTVFATYSSNFAQTLTTKIPKASRSSILDFNSQF